MITDVEEYFALGCGRCPRFETPECSTQIWAEGLAELRRLCLAAGLEETAKWGHPCYMAAGRNIAIIGAFQQDFRLTFFNAISNLAEEVGGDVTEVLHAVGLDRVAGRAMVAHIIDELIGLGIREYVLVVGYMGDRVREYIDRRYPDLTVHRALDMLARGRRPPAEGLPQLGEQCSQLERRAEAAASHQARGRMPRTRNVATAARLTQMTLAATSIAAEEAAMEVVRLPLAAAVDAVRAGTITDVKAALGLCLVASQDGLRP